MKTFSKFLAALVILYLLIAIFPKFFLVFLIIGGIVLICCLIVQISKSVSANREDTNSDWDDEEETEKDSIISSESQNNVFVSDNKTVTETKKAVIKDEPVISFPKFENEPRFYNIEILKADNRFIESLNDVFFAVDLETTGLDPYDCRIIEISAVKFEKGVETGVFSTLVKSVKHVPEAAYRINGIKDDDLIRYGIKETDALDQFADFIGEEARNGSVCLAAHNAPFDMRFIEHTYRRVGCKYKMSLHYFDTCELSRKLLDLENNQLHTVSDALGCVPLDAHRAENDARTCGWILLKLIPYMIAEEERKKQEQERILELERKKELKRQEAIENAKPTEQEMEIAAFVKKILNEAGKDTRLLKFEKKRDRLIHVKYPYSLCSFKIPKKGPFYFQFDINDFIEPDQKLDIVPTLLLYGSPTVKRVIIHNFNEIPLLKDNFIKEYDKYARYIQSFYENSEWVRNETEISFQIQDAIIETLVNNLSKRFAEENTK